MQHIGKLAWIAILTSNIAYGDGQLNIYNWSDYIAEDTIANFEAETGISVTYDMYDSNEVLEAKMMAGSSGMTLLCQQVISWRAVGKLAFTRILTWRACLIPAIRTNKCRDWQIAKWLIPKQELFMWYNRRCLQR